MERDASAKFTQEIERFQSGTAKPATLPELVRKINVLRTGINASVSMAYKLIEERQAMQKQVNLMESFRGNKTLSLGGQRVLTKGIFDRREEMEILGNRSTWRATITSQLITIYQHTLLQIRGVLAEPPEDVEYTKSYIEAGWTPKGQPVVLPDPFTLKPTTKIATVPQLPLPDA
ncbi:Hypothetical protein POVN_LOCUS511 [uncultured virus]|nr:Hypothetical protein POVN_LOCUS511 [uncultured virus]